LHSAHFDLHCHSTRSDGTLDPSEVVRRAAERGVKTLALTDHDELSGLADARAAANDREIRLIDGVEISVTWNEHTLHIVGLAIDPASEVLIEGLRRNRSGRYERAERMASQLERIGIQGSLKGARAHASNPELVSRTHFARYLVESGHARSTQAVFDRFLGLGKPGYVPHVWASLSEAVGWIVAAGGLPVLAHPGRYKMEERERAALLGSFRDLGGVGVEVVTGSHTPEQYGYWAKRAKEYGFLASTGSDFHGPRESYKDLGDLPPLPTSCVPIWTQL
jgi:predicted metal-dependent phosphoesterase TrpH